MFFIYFYEIGLNKVDLYWFSRMLFITSSTIASEASVVDIFVIQSPLNAGASFGIDDTISVVLLGVASCAGWDAACAGCAAVLAAG